jgi:glycine/D-amino acid oxidase-like deaminating enzyme
MMSAEAGWITESLAWPGAVVVGAGVTGLLAALELDSRGIAVLVIERGGVCSGQTGQCHGWLHRGAVFPDAGPQHCEQLDRGARQWETIIKRARDPGPLIDCYVGGLHERTLESVAGVWRRLGLTYQRSDSGGTACAWMVHGPESAIVPLVALRAVLAESGVALRNAEAIGIVSSSRTTRAEALLVRAGERIVRLSADAFILANGAGIGTILSDPTLSHSITRRLSFMLVVRSSAVCERGFAIPEQEALGLFGVSRLDARDRYLLLSNFLSYSAVAGIGYSQTNWLRGIRPTIERFLPDIWSAEDALWGVYPAFKVEPTRRLALGVASMSVVPTTFDNVVAGVPGKLVLAPLLAEQLADAVTPYTPPRPEPGVPRWLTTERLGALPPAWWGPEEWEVVPLVRRSTLFRGE